MNDKLFRRLLVLVTALGCISTVILVVCTVMMYRECSIISFIANGR
ncbi:MAG: hypothetical protein K2N49_03330 [Ruminococcus sp.]|nr:hypothetical protein [Ruminococcus sp.]MDE6776184.1 hypothetical protein [Ruminococcus sp.]MDE7225877.1 hypothetical protein [Ruminococcus sp.]